jgi:hypothetical protein
MVRSIRSAMLLTSGIAAFAPPCLGMAQAPYPQGMDYGISEYLQQGPVACIKAPIDGGSSPDHPVYVLDYGNLNLPDRQRAIEALEQMADLGLLARDTSDGAHHRFYRIADTAGYARRGTFCYGREVLTRIISIARPHPYGPSCVRYAEVQTEFRDIPSWMERPALAPYVDNRAPRPSAGQTKTLELRRDGDNWWASTPYDAAHSNFVNIGPQSNPCAPQR